MAALPKCFATAAPTFAGMQLANGTHSPWSTLRYDIPSGIAVFFVAIPLCLGIAHASGAPLMAGLITGVIGGLVTGSLSGSALSVSGPAAGLTAITLAAIAKLGSFEAFLPAVILAGLIQLGAGAVKSGGLARFFPSSVIAGMLSAIGVLLIIKQFPHMIGYDLEEFGVEEFALTREDINERYGLGRAPESNTLTVLLHSLQFLEIGVFLIGFASISFLFVWEKTIGRRLKTLPGSLLVVGLGIGMALVFKYQVPLLAISPEHLVAIPPIIGFGSLFRGLTMPSFEMLGHPNLWIQAATIAIVASLETLLSVEAIDRLDPHHRRTNPNRELLAQGAGNTLSGFLGGLPLTAVIVRGSVNVAAGAKSKTSAILHGALLLVALLFFYKALNLIPLACLAAILIYSGVKLVNPLLFLKMYRDGPSQYLPFLATIVGVVFTDLLVGVGIGMVVAGFFVVRSAFFAPAITYTDDGPRKRIRLGQNLIFLHKPRLEAVLERIPDGVIVEIDTRHNRFMDHDIREMLLDFARKAPGRRIEMLLGKELVLESYKMEIRDRVKKAYKQLFLNNRRWVQDKTANDPDFFLRQSEGQAPEYLFIGCSDSRVPSNEITGLDAGELFVHRNIANLVVHTDLNLMSVLQYSVEVLNVKHIIVCGHYGCGGVNASLEDRYHGLMDKWLRNIKDVQRLHHRELYEIEDLELRAKRLVELNVEEQVYNLMKTTYVQRNRELYGWPNVYGWVYDLKTGLVKDLAIDIELDKHDFKSIYKFRSE